jgi:hypothetical protein
MKVSSRARLFALSAALALMAPGAAIALPSLAGPSAGTFHPVAHQAAPANARVAIILQRKPPDRKPPPKRGH